MNYLAILDGSKEGAEALGEGALCALVAILIVFAVLAVIILVSNLVSLAINSEKETKAEVTNNSNNNVVTNTTTVDYNDEDVMAAILVATIDYRNEIKKDVKVINVREVK